MWSLCHFLLSKIRAVYFWSDGLAPMSSECRKKNQSIFYFKRTLYLHLSVWHWLLLIFLDFARQVVEVVSALHTDIIHLHFIVLNIYPRYQLKNTKVQQKYSAKEYCGLKGYCFSCLQQQIFFHMEDRWVNPKQLIWNLLINLYHFEFHLQHSFNCDWLIQFTSQRKCHHELPCASTLSSFKRLATNR